MTTELIETNSFKYIGFSYLSFAFAFNIERWSLVLESALNVKFGTVNGSKYTMKRYNVILHGEAVKNQ